MSGYNSRLNAALAIAGIWTVLITVTVELVTAGAWPQVFLVAGLGLVAVAVSRMLWGMAE